MPPPGPRRPGPEPASDEDEDEDDSDGDGSDDDVDDFLPTANEAVMEGHKKIVSCMALEHTGSRLLTGSHDYGVKIYDFNGMKRDLRPFREIVPMDGYPVHALSWSPTGTSSSASPATRSRRYTTATGASWASSTRATCTSAT